MMAPNYLQAILIKRATDEAVNSVLTNSCDLIKKVEIIGDKVVITTDAKRVTMNYSMSGPSHASGNWIWNLTNPNVRPLTFIERLKRFVR
jgi:hypothetical protein